MKNNFKLNKSKKLKFYLYERNKKLFKETIDGKKLFDLVKKSQKGDTEAMYSILKRYSNLINRRSRKDEDCKYFIISEVIYRIKGFKSLQEKNKKN